MPVNKDYYTLTGSSGQSTGFIIEQSVRFNQGDGSYLQNPNSNAGDSRKKFTFSTWFKRGNLADNLYFFQYVYSYNSDLNSLYFDTNDKLNWIDKTGGSTQMNLITNRVFRDPAAWYHIVVKWDTTESVPGERAIIYINGVRETSFGTETYPSEDADSGGANRASSNMRFAAQASSSGVGNFFDGYFAETYYSDNYSYGPEEFGRFENNGIWIPKEVDISYGAASFYFDWANASNLGANTKGKGNWPVMTDQGAGLSAGDQVLDTPTNNFCVMNAIENVPCNFTQGNLTIDSTANFSGAAIRGTVHIRGGSTGKWYYEVVGSLTGDYFSTGWMLSEIITPGSTVIGQDTGSVAFYNTGSYQNTTNVQHVITKHAAGDVIGVGLDASTGQVFLRDDSGYFVGTLSGNALSSGVVITGFSGKDLVMASRNSSSGTATYNFGQDGTFAGVKTAQGNTDANDIGNFFYTVPDGFLAICSSNLGS